MIRLHLGPVALLAATVAAVAVAAHPTRAECDGPYASFRESAPSAGRVIYGDVVAVRPAEWAPDNPRTSRFTVQGVSLIGGVRFERVDVTDVMSTNCSGYLVAQMGDRVAIAFEGRAFGTRVNAIAWVSGDPPDFAGVETITEPELFELLGVDPTSVAPPSDENGPPPWVLFALVAAAGVAAVAVAGRVSGDAS